MHLIWYMIEPFRGNFNLVYLEAFLSENAVLTLLKY